MHEGLTGRWGSGITCDGRLSSPVHLGASGRGSIDPVCGWGKGGALRGRRSGEVHETAQRFYVPICGRSSASHIAHEQERLLSESVCCARSCLSNERRGRKTGRYEACGTLVDDGREYPSGPLPDRDGMIPFKSAYQRFVYTKSP